MTETYDAHIVIIEDEPDLLELEEYHLTKAGYTVTGLLSTKYARQLMDEEVVDLLIVDRSLPGVEGSEFVASLREEGYDTPVIFVSAKDQPRAIEEGFERGGDDYMTKPFNMNELLLRVGAILRRTHAEPPERLHHRDIYLDMQHHTVMIGDREIDLSRLEFDLLRFFLLHPGADLSREALLDAVWGDHASARIATVNVTVNRLLDKIDPDRTQRYICSVRGVGYRLC
jgi:DNA-binding response OmpR family regulator